MGPEWLLIGDFNLICGAEDKNNNHLNLTMINRFKRVIDDLQLAEIEFFLKKNKLAEIALHGRKFTWCNDQRSPTMTRIDHLFASTDWLELFPKANLQALASLSTLDHCTLFLQGDTSFDFYHGFRIQSHGGPNNQISSRQFNRMATEVNTQDAILVHVKLLEL